MVQINLVQGLLFTRGFFVLKYSPDSKGDEHNVLNLNESLDFFTKLSFKTQRMMNNFRAARYFVVVSKLILA